MTDRSPGLWPTRLVNPPRIPSYCERPTHIGLELTGRCQLRCRHCFNNSSPGVSQELPLPAIQRVLEEISSWGVDQVRLTGGEPTLHRGFGQILNTCARLSLKVSLNTHGVYAEPLLRGMERAPIERFLISIDGLETTHEEIRGKGTYARAMHSARRLIAAGKKVTLALHAATYNYRQLEGLSALASELGADLKVSPLRPMGRAREQLPAAMLDFQQNHALVESVVAARQRHPRLKLFSDFDILEDSSDRLAITDAGESCGAGRSMLAVAYSGDIYPCAFFAEPKRRFSLGNILKGDQLSDVWEGSPLLQPFRSHSKSAVCRECDHYRQRCAGGCPAVSHFSSGALDQLDPLCFAHRLPRTRAGGNP